MVFYTLTVESPPSIAGDYDAFPVYFAPQLWEGVMTWPLVDAGADAGKLRRRDVVNHIALHVRSDRKSDIHVAKQLEKLFAQAILLVHKHNEPVQDHMPAPAPGVHGNKLKCGIPVFCINRADGQAISKAGEEGPVVLSLVAGVKDLYSFGAGDSGQLGLSHEASFKPQDSPQMMVRDKSVKVIGCGLHHTICLLDSGQVFTWGNNEMGQLGLGNRTAHSCPQYVEALHGINISNIAVGGNHQIAAVDPMGCYSWGWNDYMQLGHSEHDDCDEPKEIEDFRDKQVLDVAAGFMHSMALVVNWRQSDEEIAQEHRLKQVALKAQRLKSDKVDKVEMWKQKSMNNRDKKKDEKKQKTREKRKLVEAAEKMARLKARPHAEVRTIYTWGDGGKGQLGHGELYTLAFFRTQSGNKESTSQMKMKNFTCTGAPRKMLALIPKDGHAEHAEGQIIKIVARGSNSAALTNRGTILTWGDNTFGQLGLGDKKIRGTPERITQGWLKVGKVEEKMLDVVCSNYTMMALSTHSHVYAWGRGSQGCLGFGKDKSGKPQTADQLIPRLVEKVSSRGVTGFACGDSHCMVRTGLGQLYAWGLSANGRLGLEEMNDGSEIPDICDDPQIVKYFEEEDIEVGEIAGGGAHTIVTTAQFPADDVAGKPRFSSTMEVPGGGHAERSLLSACCMIS